MRSSLRILAAIGSLILVTAGCQKGDQPSANGDGRSTQGDEERVGSRDAGATAGGSGPSAAGRSADGASGDRGRRFSTLTAADDGTSIDLRQGQVVTVTLDSNRPSGLNWVMVDPPGTVMVRDGNPVYASKRGGSGGTETWRFRAARPGHQTVRLEYGRRWARSVPERTFRFTVTVR